MAEQTELQTAFELKMAGQPMQLGNAAMMALPEGYRIHDLESLQPAPRHVRAEPALTTLGALSGYLNRFASAATVAFADWQGGRIEAHIDYHAVSAGDTMPSHNLHRPSFLACRSSAWEEWTKRHDKPLSQIQFGRFLEERAHEIVDPDGATIVDLCMNLDAVKKVSFRSATRIADGYRQLTYVEEDQTKGGVRVPEMLTILIPVFEGMEPERIKVRLRYRFDDGSLFMWISIDNMDDIRRLAFERCIDALQTDHPKMPIYRGRF